MQAQIPHRGILRAITEYTPTGYLSSHFFVFILNLFILNICLAAGLDCREAALQIFNNIVNIFRADGQADRASIDALLLQLLIVQL